jgi:hypothetical protein
MLKKFLRLMYNDDVNQNAKPWPVANAGHVSSADETSPDTARYVLTVEEASRLFAEAGVPRSPRTITRFCRLGDLDCMRVETEKNHKYLIDQNSVEKRIKELHQALQFTDKTYPEMSGHVGTRVETQPDMSRHDAPARETGQPDEKVDYLRERVEELENENIHLKIGKAANEQVINQMSAERKEFIGQLNSMSFQLGEAQAKLQLLGAPRPDPEPRPVQTEPIEQESQMVEVPSEPAPVSPPAGEPAPSKRNLLGRLFGR